MKLRDKIAMKNAREGEKIDAGKGFEFKKNAFGFSISLSRLCRWIWSVACFDLLSCQWLFYIADAYAI